MKRLTLVVIFAALVWSGWWVFASQRLQGTAEDWFVARQAQGWTAEYQDISVQGFPNRLDLTVTGLHLYDPESGIDWQAPFVQLLQLVYKPGHKILILPDSQTITTAEGRTLIEAQGLRGSLRHDSAGFIQRIGMQAEVLNLTGPGRSQAFAGLAGSLDATSAEPAVYAIGLQASSIAGRERSDVSAALSGGTASDTLQLRATATLDSALMLDNASSPRPQPTRLEIGLAEYRSGGLELNLAGAVDIDKAGRADGNVTVRAVNWRAIIGRAVETGQLAPAVGKSIEEGLALVAQLSGKSDTLDLEMNVNKGRMMLGFIPLGEAPRLRLP